MSGRHRRGRQRPLHEQDQVDAAEREVSVVMDRVARSIGVEVENAPNVNPDDPTMTAFLADLREAIGGGQVRHCPHLAQPQPVFINAWDRPWTIYCHDCWAASPKPIGLEDVTCDLCGHVDPTGIWPAQVGLGYLVVSLGRCDNCTPERIKNRPKP